MICSERLRISSWQQVGRNQQGQGIREVDGTGTGEAAGRGLEELENKRKKEAEKLENETQKETQKLEHKRKRKRPRSLKTA